MSLEVEWRRRIRSKPGLACLMRLPETDLIGVEFRCQFDGCTDDLSGNHHFDAAIQLPSDGGVVRGHGLAFPETVYADHRTFHALLHQEIPDGGSAVFRQ